MREGISGMEKGLGEEAFEQGCEGAYRLVDQAYGRLEAAERRYRALMNDPNSNCVERAAAHRETAEPRPLWQQICGLDPTQANHFRPMERREGLKRLVRAFERMYRAELRLKGSAPRVDGSTNAGAGAPGVGGEVTSAAAAESGGPATGDSGSPVADALIPGASRIGAFTEPPLYPDRETLEWETNRFSDGSRSYAGRSNLFDPLPEICAYLGISERKLSQFCRQQTGLRIYEVGDCIRVENLRTHLREKFRGLVREWKDSLDEKKEERLRQDSQAAAWQFIRWMRGCGRGENRRKLGWELGIPTPARLGRAAYVVYGVSLEEEEIRAAKAVLAELETRPARPGAVEEHGACLSDVPPWEERSPFEEPWEKEEPEEGDKGGADEVA